MYKIGKVAREISDVKYTKRYGEVLEKLCSFKESLASYIRTNLYSNLINSYIERVQSGIRDRIDHEFSLFSSNMAEVIRCAV